jgi:hypothetical protein
LGLSDNNLLALWISIYLFIFSNFVISKIWSLFPKISLGF